MRACNYKTASGRRNWPNRDPLGEPGFELLQQAGDDIESDASNLYAFVRNDSVDRIDLFGLSAQDRLEEIKKAVELAQKIRDVLNAAQSGKGCACLDTATGTLCQCAANALINNDAQEMAQCFCLASSDPGCVQRALKITEPIVKAKEAAERAKKTIEKAEKGGKTRLTAGGIL